MDVAITASQFILMERQMRRLSPLLAIALLVACGKPDEDGDGFGSDVDCDDSNAAVFPGATEKCDGLDNDCDGEVDGEYAVGGTIFYADVDGDGFGGSAGAIVSCDEVEGYAAAAGDCNDADETVNPGADEVCNQVDDNCNGQVDDNATDAGTYYADLDGDGYGSTKNSVTACEMPEGYIEDGSDCNDVEASVNPAADEYCDMIDNNCDGEVDEAASLDATDWYSDSDGDGYGNPDAITRQCYIPENHSANADDCNDAEAGVNPDADEICFDGLDNNCSGGPDQCSYEGWDADMPNGQITQSGRADRYTIGDFDSDGTPDLALKKYSSYPNYGDGVSIIYGTGSFPDGNISLVEDALISGPSGTYAYNATGLAVADFDDDGTDDLIMGNRGYASSYTGGTYVNGSVGVIYGDPSGPWASDTLSSLVSSLLADSIESTTRTGLGGEVVNVGDLDGDGLDDLLISEDSGGPAGYGSGQVHIVYGGGTFEPSAALYATKSGYTSTSSGSGSATGLAVNYIRGANNTMVGFDFDGDGFRDMAVSAYGAEYDCGSLYCADGAAWIVYGDGTQITDDAEIGDAAETVFDGVSSYSNFGMNIGAMDHNGDGYDDLLVADGDGFLYNFEGQSSRWVSGSSASATSFIEGDDYSFGQNFDSGDLDDDGEAELVVAERYNSEIKSSSGAIYIFEPADISSATSIEDAAHVVYGQDQYGYFGYTLAIGDVDGDGIDDLMTDAGYDGLSLFQGVTE